MWRFSVGGWQIEIGREIEIEMKSKTEIETKRHNEVFLRLGYLDGAIGMRKGAEGAAGGGVAGVGENIGAAKRGRGVDCMGVIEGRKESIEEAKKIEVIYVNECRMQRFRSGF